jgi:hypothetical protein
MKGLVLNKHPEEFAMKLIIFFLFFFPFSLQAAATFSDGQSATDLANAIQGTGITITNPVLTKGKDSQRGVFSDGINGAGLEVDEGIILTTMTVEESFTTNHVISYSKNHNVIYSDSDLTAIDADAKYNPIIFEFDVTLDERTRLLIIDYQFASEEYHEYVGTKYNDAFGFFISGGDLTQTYNIARVVDNQTYVNVDNMQNYPPVVVNNVNNGSPGQHATTFPASTPPDYSNSAYFIDNNQNNEGGTSPVIVEYDGLTVRLNATLDNLTPGETYHVKMAIADTSDSQLNTGVFINKIRGLREPALCYDYSFKQDQHYITNDHNDTSGPRLQTDNITSSPIQVGMYIKNTEISEITTSDVSLTIFDINQSQAIYSSNSVYVTDPGSSINEHIPDNSSGMTNSASEINNIPISSFDSLEFFYTYFSLDPQTSALNLPINANLNYTITLPLSPTQSINISRFTTIDEDIPFCDGSFYDYTPLYGKFNIIQQELNGAYNLLTQVTNRPGQLRLVSLDENDLVTPKNISTLVGVDMVHLTSFHDSQASCDDLTNAIGNKTWFLFKNESAIDFAANFPEASPNTAYRMSVNLTNDGDDSLVQTEEQANGKIKVLNFSRLTQDLGTTQCAGGQYVLNPQSGQMTNQIPVACGNAGNAGISKDQLDACMECLFGYNVQSVCSRDNFAIRPEAFKISIDDNAVPLTQNFTGAINPALQDLNISAGYDYDLTVRAVHHADISGDGDIATEASIGYKTSTNYTFTWNPLAGRNVNGCNDTQDYSFNLNFNNGVANLPQALSLSQVGRYSLNIVDSDWTKVDWDPAYRTHHTGASFLANTDCTLNSANVVAQGSDLTNGCEIHSTHTNPDTNVAYVDLQTVFKPYKFDISQIQLSLGLNNINFLNPAVDFIYNETLNYPMNDYNNTMSVHYTGPVRAIGFDNVVTTNFVNNCYSENVNVVVNTMDIDHPRLDDPNQQYQYRFRFHNLDQNALPIAAHENNQVVPNNAGNEVIQIQLLQDRFQQNQQGVLTPHMNFNYDRDVNIPANPIQLPYGSRYQNVACANLQDCHFLVLGGQDFFTDSDNVTPNAVVANMNVNNVTHSYARSFTPRQSYVNLIGNAPIFYELYCNVNTGNANTQCNPALLEGTDISKDGDSRWRINPNHSSNYGSAQNITQKHVNVVTADAPATGNLPDSTNLTYDNTRGRPYTATMQHNSDPWLIYNPYNNAAVTNEFQAEFIGGASSWAGKTKTSDTTETNASQRTNRRLVW